MEKASPPNKAYSYLMMAAHFCCDINQSTIPALLPFLVAHRGIDYASAAGLIFAVSSLSSLIQPLLGIITDRKKMPWLMWLGILIAGIGVASIGFLENYWYIFGIVMFVGFGSALFHPEGGRMANRVAGEKKGRAMSIFSTGGNLGFVAGPLITVFAVSTWGLTGTTIMLIPTLSMVAILIAVQPKMTRLAVGAQPDVHEKTAVGSQKDDWPAFLRLCPSIFARSIAQNGIQTFIPLYWVGVLLQTQQQGSLMVTVMAVASVVAAFTGGRLGDRFGHRRVIRTAFAAAFPLIILMLLTKNVWIVTVLVVPLMTSLQMGFSPSVVLGQKYLPDRLGLASGVTLGLSISMGGICSPLLGKIGDSYGLTSVFYVVAGVVLAGFFCAMFIKEPVRLVKSDVLPTSEKSAV